MNNEYINYFDFEEDSIYENDELQLKIPTFCPHCNQSGKQRLIFAFKTSGTFDNYDGILLALCYDCESTTIHFLKEKQIVFDDWFTSIDSIPKKSMNISVSKYISETFPDFVKIYEQSKIAEDNDLYLIAGMGYRKSVEFLVSDYLLKFPDKSNNADKNWIKDPKTSLNQKIQKISDSRIQTVSKAITWIGNDETHYTRRHEDKDINSMKAFINALLALIELDKTVAEAEQFTSKD